MFSQEHEIPTHLDFFKKGVISGGRTRWHAPLCQHDQCNLHHYAHECFWTNPNLIASPNLRRKWKEKILRHEIGMCPHEAHDQLPEELAELLTVRPDDSDFDPLEADDDDEGGEYDEEQGEEDYDEEQGEEDYYEEHGEEDYDDAEEGDGEEGHNGEDDGYDGEDADEDYGEEAEYSNAQIHTDPYGNTLSLPGEGFF